MEKMSFTDGVKNGEVLLEIKVERNILHTTTRWSHLA
jgi:hypothetical protein